MSKKNIKSALNKKGDSTKKDPQQLVTIKAQKPLIQLFIKLSILSLIILSVIFYIDKEEYFKPEDKNNHTFKKWDAFSDFTENNNIDILLIGNSHLYTGINPKNLSAALGVNSFILASPGTNIADSYFGLKEALKKTKPQIVILETYGIQAFNPYQVSAGTLSDQFKSFSARKDFITKIISMPFLFSSQNYIYAWSNTIRNHDFIFTNKKQLEKNRKKLKQKITKEEKEELYLGRYVRFTKGIQDSTLQKYKAHGSPVDGNMYKTNDYAKHYVNKIIGICEDENIELFFLTLPMYSQHVKNYSIWKNRLAPTLGNYAHNNWIDLQDPVGYKGFTSQSFENTYNLNQHMTYTGSLIATYKVANFISDKKSIKLINRKKDQDWRKIFYGEEGFFENNSPNPKDNIFITLYSNKNKNSKTGLISEVLHIKDSKKPYIVAKFIPNAQNNINIREYLIRIFITFKDEKGNINKAFLDLKYDKLHANKNQINFVRSIKPIEILKVNKVSFLRK